MDFLRRHYEKIILGLVLVALLASVAVLLGALGQTRTEATDMVEKARLAVSGGSDIELIERDPVVDVYQALADPAVRFDVLPEDQAPADRGSLYEPPDYVVCYSDGCSRLIPFEADTCPFCRTEQPPQKGEERSPENDRDADGLPNFVERKEPFLNPDNPYDARQDYDGDAFLNVEEYKAGTAMDDPTSRPALGYNLRFGGIQRKPLPIRLKRISTYNNEDPEEWRITMEYYDPAKRRWRTKLSGVGEEVEGFTIRSARFVENPAEQGEEIAVVEVNPPGGGEPYTLREGQLARERERYVRFYYLRSRNYRYAKRGGVQTIIQKEGDEFALQTGQGRNVERETYRVDSVTDENATVVRVEPKPTQGEPPVEISPPSLKPTDFIPRNTGRTMGRGGMMMPGEEQGMVDEGRMMRGLP